MDLHSRLAPLKVQVSSRRRASAPSVWPMPMTASCQFSSAAYARLGNRRTAQAKRRRAFEEVTMPEPRNPLSVQSLIFNDTKKPREAAPQREQKNADRLPLTSFFAPAPGKRRPRSVRPAGIRFDNCIDGPHTRAAFHQFGSRGAWRPCRGRGAGFASARRRGLFGCRPAAPPCPLDPSSHAAASPRTSSSF